MSTRQARLLMLVWSLAAVLLAACGTSTPQVTPGLLNVYATSAATPWLSDVYACAPPSTAVKLSDPDSADVRLQLGQPADSSGPAYQIATEDLLVVVQPETGVDSLTRDQVRELFLGQITDWKDLGGNDLPVQVWTYAPDEDLQQIFEQEVMEGQPITSLARLSVSAQALSNSIGTEPGSVGVLPRHWKAGNVKDVYQAASVPVLALTNSEPQGALQILLGCLQAEK